MSPRQSSVASRARSLPTLLALCTAVLSLSAAAQSAGIIEAPDETTAPARARFGEGVTLDTGDGQFSLTLRGRLQLRYSMVAITGDPLVAATPIQHGFFVRRARLELIGHFLQDFDYRLQLGMSPFDLETGNANVLRDATVTWTRFRDLNVRVGQGKVQYDRQRLNSSSAMQLPDRSTVTSEFTLDRDIGVQLLSNDLFGLGGRLIYALGLHGGEGRSARGVGGGLLVSARLGIRPFGGFDDLSEADLERSEAPRLGVYVGVAHNWDARRSRGSHGTAYELGSVDLSHAVVDGLFKWRGLSLSGALHVRTADREVVTPVFPGLPEVYSSTGWGFYGQAGYVFLPGFEVVVRYSDIRGFKDRRTALADARSASVGAGWYLMDQDLKLQADYTILPGVGGSTNTGHQANLQLQLYF